MIDSSKASIDMLVVHQMGCKAEGGTLQLSKTVSDMSGDDAMSDLLKQFFFRPFKSEAYFNFTSDEGLDANMVFTQVAEVFDAPGSFLDMSVNIVNLLFETSTHPKIRGGEFYMAHFNHCFVDGIECDAVGIFKSESKETFLKVFVSQEENVELGVQEGISVRRLDKGCIVFNIERENGFRVCAVDNINKGQEARFWMEDFLGLKPREDNYFFTDNYLQMCKGFVNDVFNQENNVPRTEQIEMMNKSYDFFSKNDQFSHDEFANNVMAEPDIIQAFNDYKTKYEEDMPGRLPDDFEISKDAVKGEKKNFKSVLKLDKNFHVYVHGGRYLMEKGYDNEKDLNFYKLYFRYEQ